jgi:uncharacterized membrane protein YeiH
VQAGFIFSFVDSLGVAVGAIGGAIYASRHKKYDYDVVGAFGLAIVSALGGGVVRDILIQHGPPLALVNVHYLYAALLGTLLGLLFDKYISKRIERLILIIDAASLSLFAVAGAIRALHFGVSWLPAIFLGVITAVGGGSLRDVLSGRTPMIFERGQLYAIVALVSASSLVVCNFVGFSQSTATIISVGLGFLLRLLTLKYGWRTSAIRQADIDLVISKD